MIFLINLYKNLSFQKSTLKKPLIKLSFSDAASIKPITLPKNEFIYIESLSAVILEICLLGNSFKESHIKMQPLIVNVLYLFALNGCFVNYHVHTKALLNECPCTFLLIIMFILRHS